MPIPNPVDSLSFDNDFFNPQVKSLYEKITNGTAFFNPVSDLVGATTQQLTEVKQELLSMVTTVGTGITGVGSNIINGTALQPIIDKTDDIIEKTGGFLSHTNRLSGVDLSFGENGTASLQTLFSVGQSSVALDHTLNQVVGNPCGRLLNLFGSLFLGPDLYNNIASYYQELIGLLNNGEATIQQILGQLEAFESSIESLIANDRQYFENLLQDLTRAALAQSLPGIFEDPCGRYILDKTIGRSDLFSTF